MSTELKLTQQQAEAIGQFQKLKVGALFMRPGCGKTRTAVELVNYNHPDYLLYITPHSTISNIQDELNKGGVDCKGTRYLRRYSGLYEKGRLPVC